MSVLLAILWWLYRVGKAWATCWDSVSLCCQFSVLSTSRRLLSFFSGDLPSLPPPGRMLSKSMLKAAGRLETAHVTPLSLTE